MSVIVTICLSELIKNILGITAEFFILKALFKIKNSVNKLWVSLVSIVFVAMSFLPFVLFGNIEEAKNIADIVTLSAFISYPYFFFKLKKRSTLFLLGLIINATADFIALTVSLPFENISTLTNNLIYCAVYSLFLILLLIINKKRIRLLPSEFFENVPSVVYVAVILAELAAFYMVMLSKSSDYSKEISNVLIVLSAMLVVVCIVFVVFKLMRATEKLKRSESVSKIQLKHNEEMQNKNTDIRKFRHDYKNHMMSLNLLLEQGKFEEAKAYVSKLSALPAMGGRNYYTGNFLADAIISSKASIAEQAGIKISFVGAIPASGIENSDLSVILGNALDNAIREAEKLSPCEICVISKKSGDFVVLKISNPVKECVPIVNNTVSTTKTDSKNHGFGIEQIKSVAKKYNGIVNIECDEEFFSIEIGLIVREVKKYETVL